MKIKCPHCGNVFESLEHPQPVIGSESEVYGANFSSSNHEVKKLHSNITYGATSKGIGVGLSSVGTISQPSLNTNKPLPTGVMKKGYKEIFKTIDKHHGATWTELEDETKLSTRTLSKRLQEGKKVGMISKEKLEGRKVYIRRR